MNVITNLTPAEKHETAGSDPGLQLERIQLREIELPLKAPFETGFGITSRRRILIVRIFDKSGASGYGECTAMEEPFYNHETIDTAWTIISKYVTLMLASATFSKAGEVARILAPIQGNCMAVGAVETAIW